MEFFQSPTFASDVKDLMKQHHVPGLAIAIIQDGKIDSTGYGYACLDPERPCTADTLFDIASSSKSLTAAAVGLLVNDNENFPEVQYDAVMSTLLPEDFVMSGVGYTEGVTVEDILSHRSGLPGHNDSYMSVRAARPDNARSITRNLRNLAVAAPIRSKYIYCNMMYTVATYLVEVKSGRDFGAFLDERIFKPLNMSSTSLQPSSARLRGFESSMATGYLWNKADFIYRVLESPDCPEGQGAGSIITSVNDFIKWVKALLNREDPINQKVYEGLTRMRAFVNPNATRRKRYTSPVAYAAGLDIYYYRGHMVVGHNGVTSGWGSRFFFLPDFEFGSVIVGNSEGANSVASILVRRLVDTILGVEGDTTHHNTTKTKTKAPAPCRSINVQPKSKVNHAVKKNQEHHKSKENGQNLQSSVPQPQEMSLSAYIGSYWNPGYHDLVVQIRDDVLFVDATDRSMGFTLKFEHFCNGTQYNAHLSDRLDGGDDLVKAEFVIENGRVMKLGLHLETALKDMIWFERKEISV